MLGILLAATVAAAAPPPAPATHPIPCPSVHKLKTAGPATVGPQKLGDLPDAERYHAVWKEAGGCPIDEVYVNGRWVDRWTGGVGPRLRDATGGHR